jgi:segregation and condensation protein B
MIDQGTDVLTPTIVTEPTLLAGPPTAADLAPAIEAMLITSGRAVAAVRLAEALGLLEQASGTAGPNHAGAALSPVQPVTRTRKHRNADPLAAVALAIDELNTQYQRTGRAFRIELVAGGYRIVTLAQHAALLAHFHNAQAQGRLSKAAIETLAIIAYKQPITRARLEAIRGVACGEVLRSLLERRLINIAGRAEELGRPMLYGTTKQFLESFGLATLADLPAPSDFATLRRAQEPTEAPAQTAQREELAV